MSSVRGMKAVGSTYVEQREDNPLEERRGLVQCPAHGLVVVDIQFAVVLVFPRTLTGEANVLSNSVEKDTLQEDASLWRLHLRDKYSRGGMARLRCPVLRLGKCEHARPCREGRDDFEGLG